MKIFKKSFQYGDTEVVLETGGIARQATASVVVRVKDTVVLVTAVAKKEAREGADFFPLTINYQEKMYSAGKIPGGFLKREGRPADHETLIARLIDRPLRPLFPKGFHNEIQVVATVMSLDPEVPADIPAMIGASAALSLSGTPFQGPIGAARVGYADGKYLLNPSRQQLETSELELVVAGTDNAVLMVESEAQELPEDVMLGAVLFGHEHMQVAIQAINELTAACGQPKWDWQPESTDEALVKKVSDLISEDLKTAYLVREKLARYEQVGAIKQKLIAELVTEAEDSPSEADVLSIFSDLEHQHVRQTILNGELRIDGRDTKTVRPIRIENNVLPRAHGSAVFTRGETQAIVVTTLGNDRDAQLLDSVHGAEKDRFMLQYNFPPYCVGETGMMGSPKRREIGHGNLAKRALKAVLPTAEEFPYVLRVVSEITESNGSSSMASVCGGSLSMMDAGVPLKAPVAGVAMGLIKEGNKFAVLTDILGDEDHLGDMDFKVAGTKAGVTALQMDIKIAGITKEIMSAALDQAKAGRLHILKLMDQVLPKPQGLSTHAPRIHTIKVHPDKVRDIIGKGGATIRSITEETGVEIDLEDDGTVQIFATSGEAAEAAVKRIELITAEVEVGRHYIGKVARIVDFGAFITLLPGKDGLLHISQIQEEHLEKVDDVLSVGQTIKVYVQDVDRQGRIKLVLKGIDQSDIKPEAEVGPCDQPDCATENEAQDETAPKKPAPKATEKTQKPDKPAPKKAKAAEATSEDKQAEPATPEATQEVKS